ncbi:MAG: alpha/beta hydrolase [Cyanobacteria bacterium P01_A01_bin.116]
MNDECRMMSDERRRLPDEAKGLTEETSIAIAQNIQWVDVELHAPEGVVTVASSYVQMGEKSAGHTPLVLLHGFDSSLFEFRRLMPLLARQFEVYAIDLLGFGFCDRTATEKVDPAAIQQHLLAFCQQVVGEPVVLVGASMGGGVAIDFAVSHPEQVQRLVLLDAVGFATASGPGKLMFPPLDRWVTNFLRSAMVRKKISENAYYDKGFVSADAELCASLHLLMPRWSEALIAFTKSGGYNFLSTKIAQISMPTLVLWGRQDKILGTKDAARFEREIEQCELVWVDDCGHVPHLEQAKVAAEQIVNFLE